MQNLTGQGFGEIDEQVGKIVELHAIRCGNQVFNCHTLDQTVTNLIGKLDENVALVVDCDHLPENGPLLQRY